MTRCRLPGFSFAIPSLSLSIPFPKLPGFTISLDLGFTLPGLPLPAISIPLPSLSIPLPKLPTFSIALPGLPGLDLSFSLPSLSLAIPLPKLPTFEFSCPLD